jgi:hypothetical protein
MFKKNVGTYDKFLRLTLSLLLILWVIASAPIFGSTVITYLIGFFAFMNLVTGLLSICIVYLLFDFSTARNSKS